MILGGAILMKKLFVFSLLVLALVSCSKVSSSSSETGSSSANLFPEGKVGTVERTSFRALYLEKYSSTEDLFLISDPKSSESQKLYLQPVLLKSLAGAYERLSEYAFTYEKSISVPLYSREPLTIETPKSITKEEQGEIAPTHDSSKAIKLTFGVYEYYYDGMPTVPARSGYEFVSSFFGLFTLDVDSLTGVTLETFKNIYALRYDSMDGLEKDSASSYHAVAEGASSSAYNVDFASLKDGDFVYLKSCQTIVAM